MVQALFAYSGESYEQRVVRELRVPRTIMGLIVGSALAVSGAMMQAITRNPLAGPSILGVNSGAALSIVVALFLGGLEHPLQYVWFAFVGGGAAAVAVYSLGSAGPGGASAEKLALAGVIVSLLLTSWLTALMLLDRQTLDVVRFWMVGSLSGRDLSAIVALLPFVLVGLVGSLLLGNALNVVALGENTARALGMRLGAVRIVTMLLAVLTAASAVAIAGPIGFVGLAVPHIARSLVGPDYRRVVPLCAVLGPVALLAADISGRVAAYPSEIQVGIVTALVGAPALIALARRRTVAL